jgi:hypothetical protein
MTTPANALLANDFVSNKNQLGKLSAPISVSQAYPIATTKQLPWSKLCKGSCSQRLFP